MANKTIEKVKGMRGALYRKLTEKKDKKKPEEMRDSDDEGGIIIEGRKDRGWEAALPGFKIKKSGRIVEFPKTDDISKVNVTYPLIEPFVYANIRPSYYSKELIYNVLEPELSADEKEIMKKVASALIEIVEVELSAVTDEGKAMEYLEKQIKSIMRDFAIKVTAEQYVKIMYYIYRNFIGFNEIEPFLQDPNIEDISCDGVGAPIYIIHRKFGSLKTNIVFDDVEYLREFIIKLAERCGRYVSYAEPILAATLPDGSRVSATLAGDVATRGPTFTIRKFGENPMSPIDQIKMKTASPELLAYFWYIVENGASMLIVGGVATGKTSFLNSLCMFIPPEAKIVSIEDTRELRIPNEHWVPSLARTGFGIPMPTGEKYGGVSLFDLLKESFRQNPDYVIVGETRGKEAYVLFQGMSSGHPSMSTFHAGSVDTVIKRLITPPIELSPTLIESLNVIAVMIHARDKGKSARRIREVVEIGRVDVETNKVDTRIVYKWNPMTDIYERGEDSMFLKKIVLAKGAKLEKAYEEIERRTQVIEWLIHNNVTDYREVTRIINQYYKEPDKLMKEMGGVRKVKRAPKARTKMLAAEPLIRPEQAREARSEALGPNHRSIELTTLTSKGSKAIGEAPVGKETVIRIELDQKGLHTQQEQPSHETRLLHGLLSELKPIPSKAGSEEEEAEEREEKEDSEAARIRRQRRERIKKTLREDRESVLDLFKYRFIKQMH
jgi:flagellar protein FlaI